MEKRSAVLIVLATACAAHCANILCIFNMASVSHQIVYQPIWKELSLRGHNVTVITPNPLNDSTLINLTEIDIGAPLYERVRNLNKKFSSTPNHWILNPVFLYKYADSADIIFSNPEVSALIKDTSRKFDVILAEYGIPIGCAFAAKFKCPLVGVMSSRLTNMVQEQVGIPNHPTLYPDPVTPYGYDPDFSSRVGAVANYLFLRLFYNYIVVPRFDKIIKKHFGESIPYYGDMERNVSLVLMNSNPFIHGARPLGPNVIELSRLHIKEETRLPQDLQTFLDDAVEGAIYFSLGSNVKSALLGVEKINTILETLKQLPYKVLWKFEADDSIIDIPSNIKIQAWYPQQAILAHPNVKLFLTQGGLQSLEEAIVFKVPVLAIPFIFDQHYNAKRIVQLGIGQSLNFEDLNNQILKSSILEVATNPRYKEAIADLSERMEDEPMSAIQKAVFWIEYVIRHKGAKYLTSPLKDTPWYKFLLLDVITFTFLTTFIVCFCFYQISKLVLNPCFRKSKETKLKNN